MKRFMNLTFILALGFISCSDDKQPTASAELIGPIAAGKALTDADATRDGAADWFRVDLTGGTTYQPASTIAQRASWISSFSLIPAGL